MFPYGIGLEKIFQKKRIRIPEFIVVEILAKAGNEDVSPWIAIELSDKIIPSYFNRKKHACCKIIPSRFNYKIRKT